MCLGIALSDEISIWPPVYNCTLFTRPSLCVSNAVAAEIPGGPWLILLGLYCSGNFMCTGRMQCFFLQKTMWEHKNIFNLRFRRKADILEMILNHFCDVKEKKSTHLLSSDWGCCCRVSLLLNMSVLCLRLMQIHSVERTNTFLHQYFQAWLIEQLKINIYSANKNSSFTYSKSTHTQWSKGHFYFTLHYIMGLW